MDVKPRKQIICNPRFEREIKLMSLQLNSNSQYNGYFIVASKFYRTLSSSHDRTTQIDNENFTVTLEPSIYPLKARSSVDSVISIIVKTAFGLMLLFDIEKVCRTKILTKK